MIPIKEMSGMLSVVVVAMIIVFMAMMIDLASGLYKAKCRGEIRTSEGLRRTLTKFITYEGGMLIAAGVDVMIQLSRIIPLFHLNLLCNVPLITLIVGIFLLVVEFLSVKEKADDKTKKNLSDAAKFAIEAASRKELTSILKAMYEASLGVKNEVNETVE